MGDYKDVKLGKSSSVRSRRTKNAYQPEDSSITSGSKRKSPNKKQLSSVKKRAPKITPETKSSGLQQPDEHVSPSFHMSQTQALEVPPSYSKKGGPLTGYSFFYSGIDPNFQIEDKIKRLNVTNITNMGFLARVSNL